MSDKDKQPPGSGIQRYGSKDRKKNLGDTGPLFPPDDSEGDSLPPGADEDATLPGEPLLDEEEPFVIERAVAEITPEDSDDPGTETRERASVVEAETGDQATAGEVIESDAIVALEPVSKSPLVTTEERFPPVQPQVESGAQPITATPVPRSRRSWRQDLIAAFFLFASVALLVYFAVIWQNPYSPLNPLAPPTPFVIITTTPQESEANTGEGIAFSTPTLTSSDTSPSASFPFAQTATGVVYIPNANGRDCNWASIAGTVTGLQGEALDGYGVRVTGTDLDEKVFSGTALTFGPGGFELVLGNAPVRATVTVRLFSPTGAPLSDEYAVITRDDCDQNVALVNFIQKREI